MFTYGIICLVVATLLIFIILRCWLVDPGRCSSRIDGKTVLITDADNDMGKTIAVEMARRGAKVILGCRDDVGRGVQTRDEIMRRSSNKDVHVLPLDLASLDSVRRFVQLVKQCTTQLHVLINNTGVYGIRNKLTQDGLQEEMQVNHFGPFLLTLLLIETLKASTPSRIITITSMTHQFADLTIRNLNSWSGRFRFHCNSKLANVLFSNELARRLSGTGVTSNCLHPGLANTPLLHGAVRRVMNLAKLIFGFAIKNAIGDAQTVIYLAVAEEVKNVTGKYFVDCKESSPSKEAQNEKLAQAIWNETIRLMNLQPEEITI